MKNLQSNKKMPLKDLLSVMSDFLFFFTRVRVKTFHYNFTQTEVKTTV